MCIKKIIEWFVQEPEPIPEPQEGNKKTALLFGINNYPGTSNDLNGCINDILDIDKKLSTDFPEFKTKLFKDSQVTKYTFITEVTKEISLLIAGDVLLVSYSGHGTQVYDTSGDEADGYDEAVYLYDGSVIDDDIGDALKNIPDGATVVLMFDSCFSGTVTRLLNGDKTKFVQTEGLPPRKIKRKRFKKSEMKWIVFSGCSEQQTSADANINGKYNGAFTFYALKTLSPDITYRQWITKIHQYLPSNNFSQNPTLEGREGLFDKKVLT